MRPEHVQKYIKESLAALQVDYVDLYLIHVPIGMKNVEGSLYPTLEDGTIDWDMTTDHVAIWKVIFILIHHSVFGIICCLFCFKYSKQNCTFLGNGGTREPWADQINWTFKF